MQPLYEFSSANDFLKARFENSKRDTPSLTIEKYATETKIGVSSLKMIFSGKRDLTIKQALSAARALKLSPAETEHFEALTLRQSSDEEWEKAYFDRKLQKQRRELKVRSTGISRKELLIDPLALRLLVYLMELGDKRQAVLESPSFIKLIAKQFNCTAERVEVLVKELSRLGVLEPTDNRGFHIVFERISHRQLQKKYLKALLAEAAKLVETNYDSPVSHFVGYTFTASDSDLINLREEIKTLMERYMSKTVAPGSDIQIAQANFQVYPTAKLPGGS